MDKPKEVSRSVAAETRRNIEMAHQKTRTRKDSPSRGDGRSETAGGVATDLRLKWSTLLKAK